MAASADMPVSASPPGRCVISLLTDMSARHFATCHSMSGTCPADAKLQAPKEVSFKDVHS